MAKMIDEHYGPVVEALKHASGAINKLPEDTFGYDDNGAPGPEFQQWPMIAQLQDECTAALEKLGKE